MSRKLIISIIMAIIAIIVAAVATTTIFVARSANNIDRQIELGYKYLEDGNYEEAIIAFERAIELDEKNIDAYMGLAEVYVEMDEIDDAIEALEEVIDIDDEEEDAYELLVELLLEEGEVEAARTIIEEGLEETESSKLLDYQEMLSGTQNDETISDAESGSQDVFDETEEAEEAVEMVKIPILVGMSQEEAISKLEAINIEYIINEQQIEATGVGIILSQSDEGSVEADTVIELLVAIERTFIVPNLVGVHESEIEDLLGDAITYTVSEAESETVAEDYVISQSIVSGSEVTAGAVVEVVISTGHDAGNDEVTFEDAALEAGIRETLADMGEAVPDILTRQDVLKITELNLGDRDIYNLGGIENLSNLTELDLLGNSISDISGLSGLSNLTKLYLSDTNISDISGLSGLSNLTNLSLSDTNISDTSENRATINKLEEQGCYVYNNPF